MSQVNQNIVELNIETPAEFNITTPIESITDTPVPLSILFIMDGSGSMENMGNEPLQGLNSLVSKQKETGDFRFTLVVFNDESKVVINDMNGKDVPVLTSEHYTPHGMTALLDAMGKAINTQKERKTENVLVVILTDGIENCSNLYTKEQIRDLTKEMETEHKWKFSYLGANQDSFSVATSLGITTSNNYDYTPRGCNRLFAAVSHEISRCVSGDVQVGDFKVELKNEDDEPNNDGDIKQSIAMDEFFEVVRPQQLNFSYSS